jgi:hypothetical protein
MLTDKGLIAKEYADIICHGKQSVRQLGRLPELSDLQGSESARFGTPLDAPILALVELTKFHGIGNIRLSMAINY